MGLGPTLWTFWVACYLEIVVLIFLTLDPPFTYKFRSVYLNKILMIILIIY